MIGDGQPAATARAKVDQLFGAVGARFADPWRDQKYDSARIRIANAAFLPSRVWNDTSVWIVQTPSRRTLYVNGHYTDARYRLEAEQQLQTTTRPADSRHIINLTRLASDEYAWDTDVTYAVGAITAAELGSFIAALVASAEGSNEHAVRSDYRATIPRASAVLGQLFSIDSIVTRDLADKSTLASFAVSITPAGVEARFPSFARYLRRYAQTTRMDWTLADLSGTPYIQCSAQDGHLSLRVRTLGGAIVPLPPPLSESVSAAPAALLEHPLPDSLLLTGSFTMRVRRFTIGFREYRGELTLLRTDHERTANLVTRQEPDWVLPLATKHLIRTPLRRPFKGTGAVFRLGIRDSVGAQSVLHRRLHLEVEESLILRFLGRLGAIAVSDFAGRAEREQSAWVHEVFMALLADIGAFPYPVRESRTGDP